MANKPNFSGILDRQSTGVVERPKPHPVGNYVWVVKGLPEFGESQQKKTPFVQFTASPIQAMDDVEAEALDAFLTRADNSKKSLPEMTQRLTFYITEDAAWRLDKFLEDCGCLEEGKTRTEMIEATPGCQFIGTIKHTASDDGTVVYANIAGTAKAE